MEARSLSLKKKENLSAKRVDGRDFYKKRTDLFFLTLNSFSFSFSLKRELLGVFPREALATEMTVSGGLLVDGVLQLEVLDDSAWAEVEVLLDDIQKLLLALCRRTVAEDGDGEWLGDTDGVGDLDQDASAESGLDEGLGDPAGGVGGGAIHFGEVLSGESATTVGAPSSVSVDDDLTASQTGVSHGTTDDEFAGRLQVVDGVLIQVLGGDDGDDHAVHQDLSHVLQLDVFVVLNGDDDGVHALGDASTIFERVFAGDLSLGVGSEPLAGSVASEFGHSLVEFVSEDDGEGHGFLGLVRGVAEHESLISGSGLILITTNVHALSDIGGLLFEGDQDVAGLVVESFGGVVVADMFDGVADDFLVVDDGFGGDFSADEDHTSLGDRFAGDFGVGVLLEVSIEDGIRHLIADLVGMTFSDGFGGEEERLDVFLSNFVAGVEICHF